MEEQDLICSDIFRMQNASSDLSTAHPISVSIQTAFIISLHLPNSTLDLHLILNPFQIQYILMKKIQGAISASSKQPLSRYSPLSISISSYKQQIDLVNQSLKKLEIECSEMHMQIHQEINLLRDHSNNLLKKGELQIQKYLHSLQMDQSQKSVTSESMQHAAISRIQDIGKYLQIEKSNIKNITAESVSTSSNNKNQMQDLQEQLHGILGRKQVQAVLNALRVHLLEEEIQYLEENVLMMKQEFVNVELISSKNKNSQKEQENRLNLKLGALIQEYERTQQFQILPCIINNFNQKSKAKHPIDQQKQLTKIQKRVEEVERIVEKERQSLEKFVKYFREEEYRIVQQPHPQINDRN